ncbi:MAG TPA: four-carbon acid sugar kinase family protein [Anaerolineales bacterium]
MGEPQPVSKADLIAGLPPVWPDDSLRSQIAALAAASGLCVAALDDDPTGTQTVHDIWVLTAWEPQDLKWALEQGEPAIYVLTNSRSLPLEQAQALNREVAANLAQAAREAGRPLLVVSRSDSTLRGHFPGEVDALSEALETAWGRAFDGLCLIPFFPEGGRYTVYNTHYVQEGERLVPAGQTPYAQDPVFGYTRSNLPQWVEEKTGGRVPADHVATISIELLRQDGPQAVAERLESVRGGQVVVVNAAADRDLEVFALGLLQAYAAGKRFLFRTAASFVKVAAGISDRSLLSAEDLRARRPAGSEAAVTDGAAPGGTALGGTARNGLIVFGSFVPKSSAQLERVLALPGVLPVELSVAEALDEALRGPAIERLAQAANAGLRAGQDVLLYTSRQIVTAASKQDNLSIGQQVSSALMEVVRRVEVEPSFVIGKGGITSSDLATAGMGVRAARVLGQVRPGVPVWQLGLGSRWPGVPYVVFPGNVGEAGTVAEVVELLRQKI